MYDKYDKWWYQIFRNAHCFVVLCVIVLIFWMIYSSHVRQGCISITDIWGIVWLSQEPLKQPWRIWLNRPMPNLSKTQQSANCMHNCKDVLHTIHRDDLKIINVYQIVPEGLIQLKKTLRWARTYRSPGSVSTVAADILGGFLTLKVLDIQ